MSKQEKQPETLSSLLESIDNVIFGIEHIGGHSALNEYGRGQYQMMMRMKHKLESIQKASEDAYDNESKD